MSHSYEVFVEKYVAIEQVIQLSGEFIGHDFVRCQKEDGEIFFANTVGLTLRIYLADFLENDREMEFEKYSVMIDISQNSEFRQKGIWNDLYSLFPRALASFISSRLNCECLVTDDLQSVVEVFPAGI